MMNNYLIASFFIVFLLVGGNIKKWGFIPAAFWGNIGGEWIKLFTNIFVHANIIHLVLNSFTLYQFGKDVESYLGPIKYLIFFILAGVLETFLYALIQSTSTKISIGASGAISAVVAVYLLRSGDNNRFMRVVQNEVYSLLFKPYTNISYLAHILGFGIGWAFYKIKT